MCERFGPNRATHTVRLASKTDVMWIHSRILPVTLLEILGARHMSLHRSHQLGISFGEPTVCHRSQEGFEFTEQLDDWASKMSDAQFCFAPAEDGFSKRVVEAAAFGCIPVIVQDGIDMPFEEVLPYDQFSVRVSEKVRSLSHPCLQTCRTKHCGGGGGRGLNQPDQIAVAAKRLHAPQSRSR